MGSRSGRIRLKTVWSPPIMNVRLPLSAPGVDPVIGASRKSTPLALRAWPMWRLWLTAMVLQSTTTDPERMPSMMPLEPRITSFAIWVSPTHRKSTSAFSATSFGVAQNLPFSVSASFWALADVLDQTATSCPARRRLRAMGYPMRPSPRNPSLGMKVGCTRLAGRGTNRRWNRWRGGYGGYGPVKRTGYKPLPESEDAHLPGILAPHARKARHVVIARVWVTMAARMLPA